MTAISTFLHPEVTLQLQKCEVNGSDCSLRSSGAVSREIQGGQRGDTAQLSAE